MSKHTKAGNLDNPDSCWNRAADDEPVFVLRATDPVAAKVIRYWVTMRYNAMRHTANAAHYANEMVKLDDADRCQKEMRAWYEAQKHLQSPAPAVAPEEGD